MTDIVIILNTIVNKLAPALVNYLVIMLKHISLGLKLIGILKQN